MKNDWRAEKATLESSPDVRVQVIWNDNKNYTAYLNNYGSPVNLEEGPVLRIFHGEGSTGAAAINSLFADASGQTLRVVEGGTCRERRVKFSEDGYRPL